MSCTPRAAACPWRPHRPVREPDKRVPHSCSSPHSWPTAKPDDRTRPDRPISMTPPRSPPLGQLFGCPLPSAPPGSGAIQCGPTVPRRPALCHNRPVEQASPWFTAGRPPRRALGPSGPRWRRDQLVVRRPWCGSGRMWRSVGRSSPVSTLRYRFLPTPRSPCSGSLPACAHITLTRDPDPIRTAQSRNVPPSSRVQG